MVWIYGRGHTVVGVEACYEAAACVFTDVGIKYTSVKVPEIQGHLLKVGADYNI